MRELLRLLCAVVYCVAMVMNGSIGLFIDFSSLMMLCVPCVIGYAMLGGERFKYTLQHAVFDKPVTAEAVTPLLDSLFLLQSLFRTCGLIGGLMGLLLALFSLDDPRSIGPAMAFGLLSILYAAFIAELLIGSTLCRYTRLAIAPREIAKGGQGSGLFVCGAVCIACLSYCVLLFSLGVHTPHGHTRTGVEEVDSIRKGTSGGGVSNQLARTVARSVKTIGFNQVTGDPE